MFALVYLLCIYCPAGKLITNYGPNELGGEPALFKNNLSATINMQSWLTLHKINKLIGKYLHNKRSFIHSLFWEYEL